MPMVRAIFFDIGDTLVFDDPPLPERFWRAMQAAGIESDKARLPQAFRLVEAYALEHYMRGVAWDAPGLMRECAARLLSALDAPALDERGWAQLSEAFASQAFRRVVHPGAIPLLEALRGRGFQVGAISDWEETLPELLAELALAPHLDALAVSAIVGATKPNPLIFQEALRQINVRSEVALHVGDFYELDVAGARAAGMRALLFDWRNRSPQADCPRVVTFEAMATYLRALGEPGIEMPGYSGESASGTEEMLA